jgi:hypothetical protein
VLASLLLSINRRVDIDRHVDAETARNWTTVQIASSLIGD